MSAAAAAIFIRPATPVLAQLLKPRPPDRIIGPRLHFYTGKSYYYFCDKKLRCANSMTQPIGIQAGNGDGGIRAFEREALVDGSSSFAPIGLQATLNNLVSSTFFSILSLCLLGI